MTIDYDSLETVVVKVMRHIANLNVDSFTKGDDDRLENDVDASFFALSYAFPGMCLGDTVTRRCAKSEIYDVLEEVVAFRAANPGIAFQHLFDQITGESVMEDIHSMHDEDFDSDD